MFVVRDCVHVRAPLERCFLLSTSVELTERALGLRAARRESSRSEGLAVAGDRIMWRGWRFGLPQMHESVVSRYERPSVVQSTMGRGRFKRLEYEMRFQEIDGQVLVTGSVRFSLGAGRLGRWVGRRAVVPQMTQLLRRRLELLRLVAEGEEWRRYLHEDQ